MRTALLAASLFLAAPAAQESRRVDPPAARRALDRALAFLVATQHDDGSWARSSAEGLLDSHYAVESFYAWQVGAHQLACLALLEAPATEARDAALRRGMGWLLRMRVPLRGSDWDNDAVWAYLYGVVLCVRAASDPRAGDREPIAARGREFLAALLRNESPGGGFAYYDDRPYTRRPTWSTSFCTALVMPSLAEAYRLGWMADDVVVRRSLAYVRRCALPEGAYEYDLRPVSRITGGEHINRIKGSLGRTQVCNWARLKVGDDTVDVEALRGGLEAFFAHHRFLDVARMRPVPHEAYYANAGYFYMFGHYYAALAIELLPETEREGMRRRLRHHVIKVQRDNGAMCDFLGQEYLVVAGTAFGALALTAGL